MFLFLSQWIKSICRRMTYHLLISTGAFILPIIFLLVSFTAFGLFVIDPEQAKISMNKFSIHQFIDLHKNRIVCSARPKPVYGIGNRTQSPILAWVSEPNLFFQKLKKKHQNFLMCYHFFYKLENEPRSSNIIWKYFIWQHTWYRKPLYDGKNTQYYW
jgi:hypothetical protein